MINSLKHEKQKKIQIGMVVLKLRGRLQIVPKVEHKIYGFINFNLVLQRNGIEKGVYERDFTIK